MRATLHDVVRHPSWLGSWWLEWPGRRRHWWREMLREPGQGWLRWAAGHVEVQPSYWEPPELQHLMPPARRLATWLRYRATLALPWNRADARGLSGGSLREWSACYVSDDRRRLWRQG